MKCTDVYSLVKDFGEVGLRRRLAFRLHLSAADRQAKACPTFAHGRCNASDTVTPAAAAKRSRSFDWRACSPSRKRHRADG